MCVWPFTTKFGYTWKTLVVRFVAQMTLGSSLNSPLYFLFILVLFTICLWLFPKIYCSTKTLCSIVIFSLIFQYTGMNHFICDKFPFGANNVFGRIVEFAPYAAMGICLRRFNLEGRFNPFALCINGVILLFAGIAMSRVSMFQCIGFGYQGVALFFQGIGLFVVAIGFGQVISERFNKPIKYVAALTPGVYYSHRLIGDCLVCVFHDVCCITLLVFMASAVLIALLMQIRVMRKFVC